MSERQEVDLFTNLPVAHLPERYSQFCRIHARSCMPEISAGAALWLDDEGLCLLNAAIEQPLRLSENMLERRLRGRSLLLQACAAERGGLSVLDACAGFGLDAFTLVLRGCSVTACEQHPLVWLMLCDFAERLDLGAALEPWCGDSMAHLQAADNQWDVVYLDPMFPARRKKALPNLGLQHLQQLTADSQLNLEQWLGLARDRATRRVVLKRRLKDSVLGNPAYQLKGQAVRFDVYLC